MYDKAIKYVFISLIIPVLIVSIIAKSGLSIWLGSEFANKSYLVMQILSFGVLINGLSLIPFASYSG